VDRERIGTPTTKKSMKRADIIRAAI